MDCLIALGGRGPKWLPEGAWRVPLIVAADSGADLLAAWGRRAHLVVGDFDSVTEEGVSVAETQERHPPTKIESDAELAMLAARKKGARSWRVVGGSGGRMDHFLGLWHLVPRFPEWKEWWLEEDSFFILRDGETLKQRGGHGDRVSVFCHSPTTESRVVSTGLRWPLDALDWLGTVSLSNEMADNEFRLRSERGLFLAVRPWEDAYEFSV